jgi:hypothetical protein
MSVPNVISFSEFYPFDFETKALSTDEVSQITADENAKAPDEESGTIKTKSSGGGTFTKNKLLIALLVVGGLIALTQLDGVKLG